MKKNTVQLIVLFTTCLLFNGCGSNKEDVYNSINLYFSPTEDYLMRQEFFPNFINYPNDRVKLGLRGNVKDIKYNSLHSLAYLFNENGQILGKIFIASGGNNKETKISEHIYDENGFPVQIVEESMVDFGKGNRSAGKKEIDKITAHTLSGKPLVRAINELNRNRIDHIVNYEYDENDICRGVTIAEDSPNKKENALAFDFNCDEKGLITYIYAKRTRIPYRLTQGERKIYPVYDNKGRLVSMKEISIPKNMEAYRIDSISSETQYQYNKEGDIIECIYSDIIYPDNNTNDFKLTFKYEYDKQGNWTKKHIIGEIKDVNASMNTYYRDNYAINRIDSEGSENLGEIIIERTISYYGNEESNNKKDNSHKVNIPKSTGFLGQPEYYEMLKNDPSFGSSSKNNMPVMSSSDRKKYKIDDIDCIDEEKVIYGKNIYKTDSWRMESILGYTPEFEIYEYFVFYDKYDNVINCLNIGSHLFYAGDITRTEIEGNIITCSTEWSEPESSSGTVFVQYEISPQLMIEEIKRWEE